MESVLSRHRNLIVLLGVLFLQALGLAVQVRHGGGPEAHDTRLIRVWAIGTLSPFERSLVWIQDSTGNIWRNYVYLRGVRAENRELKEQIEQMRLERVRLNEDAAQAHRLQNLLGFKEEFVAKTVAAQVIGTSGTDTSRIVFIDKGENSGIRRDMAVMTADGIVGKVLMVWPSLAQVLLINDQSSGVGVILERSRLQGVLRGTANGEVDLEHIMKDEDVAPGDRVLTSGGDQIFPKGFPVGTVAKVDKGKDVFLNIRVKPSAGLSKLEEVLVLLEKQERAATADENPHLRASDILAQRLPSVPAKPAAVTPTGTAAASLVKPGPAGTTTTLKLGTNLNAAPANKAAGTTQAVAGTKPGNITGNKTKAAAPSITPQNAAGSPALSGVSTGQPRKSASVTTAPSPSKPDTGVDSKPTQPTSNEIKPATPPSVQPNPQPPADDNPH